MLRQKALICSRKLEMVISIKKIGKRIQNKNKIKNKQTKNRKKESQLPY